MADGNGATTSTMEIKRRLPYWWGAIASFFSALFFFLGFLLSAIRWSGVGNAIPRPKISEREYFQRWLNLDPDFLRTLWKYRASVADLEIAMDALGTIAFLLLLASVSSLADAFESNGGHKATKTLLVPCFTAAAVLMVVDLTFNAGTTTTAAWMSQRWILDDAAVRRMHAGALVLNLAPLTLSLALPRR